MKKYWKVLLTTPFWWWLVTRLGELIGFYRKSLSNFNFGNRFSWPQYTQNIYQMRFNSTLARENYAKFFYNKALNIINEVFNYLSFLSPRIYFQAGDPTVLAPQTVEPIAGPLFVAFVFGVIYLIKQEKIKYLFWVIAFSFLAYVLGQKNIAFLLPIYLIYLQISTIVIKNKLAAKAIMVFSIFLVARMLLV